MKRINPKTTWRKVKLGDVLELKYGFALRENNRQTGEVPVYASSGIVGYHNKAAVKSAGIIVGRKGNVGSISFSARDFFPIDTVYYIDSLKVPGDLKFFYYLLQKVPFKQVGSDVGVPGLNRDMAYSLDVNIPEDPKVQKRIAEILSAFDEKIELNNKINQALEQLAQAIFKEWFVKFRFPGHEKVEMIDSELGKIPKGWEIKTLDNICATVYGKDLPTRDLQDHGYPVYGGNGIIGFSNKFNVEYPKVIIGCRGAYSGNVFKTTPKSFVTHNSLILNSDLDTDFLYFMVKNLNIKSTITGSAQPQITINELEKLEVAFPKKNAIEYFILQVGSIEQKRLLCVEENEKLIALRFLLLSKLMKGE